MNNNIKNFNEFVGNTTNQSFSVNEKYIEMAQFDEPTTELINAFKEWYNDTKVGWNDTFKNYLNTNTIDEAAKNAQIEILAYLSNEMNKVIKDSKFRVKADFK